MNSRWILDEADVGVEQGVFIHVTLDGTPPPLGFRRIQFASLEQWDGDINSEEFGEVIKAVEHFVGRPESS